MILSFWSLRRHIRVWFGYWSCIKQYAPKANTSTNKTKYWIGLRAFLVNKLGCNHQLRSNYVHKTKNSKNNSNSTTISCSRWNSNYKKFWRIRNLGKIIHLGMSIKVGIRWWTTWNWRRNLPIKRLRSKGWMKSLAMKLKNTIQFMMLWNEN